jgi:hypothetical protein
MLEPGKLATKQMRRAITTAQHATQETRKMLLRALPALDNAVEQLCPVAMKAGPYGVETAYGPLVPDDTKTLVIIATNDDKWLTFDNVGELPEIRTPYSDSKLRASLWGRIHKAVHEGDGGDAMIALNALIGPGWASMDETSRVFRSHGLFPAVATVVSANDTGACGATLPIALPPTINLSLADCPGFPRAC